MTADFGKGGGGKQMSRAGKTPAGEWRLDRAALVLARTPWGRSGYARARGLMRLFVWIEHICLGPPPGTAPGG